MKRRSNDRAGLVRGRRASTPARPERPSARPAWYGYDGYFPPYVSVAERKAQGARELATLLKTSKRQPDPIVIASRGRHVATTFWGKAWCDNLERYADFANRLPRGRTYVRNGSVIDLQITAGAIKALVSGSDIYTVAIKVAPVS